MQCYGWKLYLFLCFRRRWPDTMSDTHGKSVPALPKIKRQSNKGKYFVCQLLTTSERRNKGTSTGRYLHHAKGRVNHWSTAIFIKSYITAVMIRDKNTLKKWQIIYQWEVYKNILRYWCYFVNIFVSLCGYSVCHEVVSIAEKYNTIVLYLL